MGTLVLLLVAAAAPAQVPTPAGWQVLLEKQPDGAWKCKLAHWSGPMNWLPNKPEKAAAKK